jgi:hypothetical protein
MAGDRGAAGLDAMRGRFDPIEGTLEVIDYARGPIDDP